jgi:hypothetical protein
MIATIAIGGHPSTSRGPGIRLFAHRLTINPFIYICDAMAISPFRSAFPRACDRHRLHYGGASRLLVLL